MEGPAGPRQLQRVTRASTGSNVLAWPRVAASQRPALADAGSRVGEAEREANAVPLAHRPLPTALPALHFPAPHHNTTGTYSRSGRRSTLRCPCCGRRRHPTNRPEPRLQPAGARLLHRPLPGVAPGQRAAPATAPSRPCFGATVAHLVHLSTENGDRFSWTFPAPHPCRPCILSFVTQGPACLPLYPDWRRHGHGQHPAFGLFVSYAHRMYVNLRLALAASSFHSGFPIHT